MFKKPINTELYPGCYSNSGTKKNIQEHRQKEKRSTRSEKQDWLHTWAQ